MNFQEFLVLCEGAKLSASGFPLLMQPLKEQAKAGFEKSLDIINSAVSADEIVNPMYGSVKYVFNQVFENAYTKLISEKYFYGGKWESLPTDIYDAFGYSYPQLHNIGSFEKKIAKIKDTKHVFMKDLIALINEMKPIAVTMSILKEKIVKKPRADVERAQKEQKHRAQVASHDDVKRIREQLTTITENVYKDALAANYKWLLTIAEHIITTKAETKKSLYDLFKMDPFAMHIGRMIITHEKFGNKEVINENYKNILKKEATRMTKEMMDRFIEKNTKKLSEIVVKKNNLKDIKLVKADTARGVVEGIMTFTFKDKSYFTVNNKVVMSYSKYDKPFYRFPTTFHNVYLPTGERMSKPSEERMIDVFPSGKD